MPTTAKSAAKSAAKSTAKKESSAKKAAAKAPASRAAPSRKPAAASQGVQFKWFVADEVRHEPGGKITLVGLYPDNVILARLPEGTQDPTPREPLTLPGLSLLCVITGLAGNCSFTLVLDDSNVGEFPAQGDGASSCNMVFRLPAIEVRSWGLNTVALKSKDGKLRGETSFEIRRALG